MPARRLEWRTVILTTEKDTTKLNKNNYLIISTAPKQIIFNDYKTDRKYGKQIFNIPQDSHQVINKYLFMKSLKSNDYLFGLLRNKQEYPSEGNFSQKISNIFNKVHKIPISIRFIRMSHISQLLSSNPNIIKMELLAEQMAHSINEQRLYNKIDNQ